MHSQLNEGLEALNIELNNNQIDRLCGYVELLFKWNRIYNLTAVRTQPDMMSRHILDSLSLCPWIDGSVVDLGSGAGLPVIPLAIAKPRCRFISIESNGKKTRFQHQALLELDVSNVEVRQIRAESLAANTLFENAQPADIVVSRAFTAPSDFLTVASPLLKSSGVALVMLGHTEKLSNKVSDTLKTKKVSDTVKADALKAVSLPAPFVLETLHRVDIPGVDAERHVAVCRKGA